MMGILTSNRPDEHDVADIVPMEFPNAKMFLINLFIGRNLVNIEWDSNTNSRREYAISELLLLCNKQGKEFAKKFIKFKVK